MAKMSSSIFAQKIQQDFYAELFYGNPSQKSAIAAEVLRLYAVLPEQYKNTFDEIESLIEIATQLSNESACSLKSVYKALKVRGLIRTLDVAAFITVELALTSYDKDKFDQYKALVLIVVTQLSFNGEHRHKIISVCNEIRQYAYGKRSKVTAYLPNLIKESFPTLIDYFDEITSDKAVDPYICNKLSYYKTSIRDSYQGKQGFHRRASSREYKKSGSLNVQPKQLLDDTQLSYIIEIQQNEATEQDWENEDRLRSNRTLSLVSSKSFAQRDPHTNAMQARSINQHIRQRDMFLTCSISHVCPNDIHQLIDVCLKALSRSENDKYASALLLMLISGNTFEEVKSWKIARCTKTRNPIGIQRRFELPSQVVRSEISQTVRNVDIEYILPIPACLQEPISKLNFKDTSLDGVHKYYQTIKKKHSLTLNFSGVSRFLVQTLKANRVSMVIAGLITGQPPQSLPSRYYTCIPYSIVVDSYSRYCNYLARLSCHAELQNLTSVPAAGELGSPLFIDPIIIKTIFERIALALSTTKPSEPAFYASTYHNLRVINLQLLLGLASGYRPVKGWFGTINDIHQLTGEYRIAEKEREVGYRGRVVILPNIVLAELKKYIAYCQKAEIFYERQDHICQRFKEAISGEQSFCFYIHQNKIDECTPSTFSLHSDSILPLQPNWTRHYLRSYLFKQGISDELIDAWMGHQNDNQLPFEQFSQLPRKALLSITNLLEEHIKYLHGGYNE